MEDWRSIHSSVLCDSFFHIFLKARARSFAAVFSFSFCNRRPYKSVVGQIFAVKVSAYEIQLVDNGKMLENTNWKGSEWTCECVCVCRGLAIYSVLFYLAPSSSRTHSTDANVFYVLRWWILCCIHCLVFIHYAHPSRKLLTWLCFEFQYYVFCFQNVRH